jgi:hypothetical protein
LRKERSKGLSAITYEFEAQNEKMEEKLRDDRSEDKERGKAIHRDEQVVTERLLIRPVAVE